MKNNRLESIITQSLERFYSRLMPILNSKQPKESGKGLTKNDLTDELKGKYDEAVNMSHGHANKNILDNTNASFTTALKSNYDDAVNKSHTHSNKTILDNTNESFTTDIKTQINTNKSNISKVADYINDSDLITDSESKMVKTVPTNANHACGISMIGGKTVKSKNLLRLKSNLSSETINGVTFTPVFDSHNNLLYVNVNGTASATTTYTIFSGTPSINFSGYKLSMSQVTSNNTDLGLYIEHNGSPYVTLGVVTNNDEVTISTYDSSIYANLIIFIRLKSGGSASNIRVYPMIRKASEPSGYEPYFEGLRSAPVESVVSIYGKNFFPKKSVNLSYSSEIATGLHIPAGDYVFSAIGSSTISINVIFNYIDGTSKMVLLGIESSKRTAVAVSLTSTVVSISTYVNGSIKINDVQLEKGKAMTAYEPYHETTLLIPEAIKNLPDYGCSVSDTIYNWVDFENGVYHHVVGSVDMSNMVWTKNTAGTPLYYADTPTGAKVNCEAVCSKFTTVKNKAPEAAGQLRVHEPTYHKAYLYTGDNSMGRPEVAEYCKGVMLNYELATEELIDISDILHPIRVETGGTITFNNEHSIDMPNTVIYKKEVSLS